MENKSNGKVWRTILLVSVMLVLVVCAFGGGFAAGHFLPASKTASNQGGTPADRSGRPGTRFISCTWTSQWMMPS